MSSRHIATARRAAAAIAAVACSASAAAAQSYHIVGTYGHFESPTYRCDAPSGVRSFGVLTCDGGGAIGRMSARVDADNSLHAMAEVTATPSWGNTHYRATSEAYFYDRIEFSGDVPASLRFDLRLHGNVGGWMTTGQLLGYGWGSEPVWGLGLQNTTGWEETFGTFVVPVVNGVAVFGLQLVTNAQIVPPIGACEVADCSHSIADFSNTASIQRIVGFDGDGNQITGGLQARTASGVAYALQGGTILSAPEPASLALMGVGAAPLAWLAGRRRRQALARR